VIQKKEQSHVDKKLDFFKTNIQTDGKAVQKHKNHRFFPPMLVEVRKNNKLLDFKFL
jgi:hypothetical protein